MTLTREPSLDHAASLSQRAHVLDLINAGWTTQVLSTAAQLRLMDCLASAPRTVEAAATACQCTPHYLRRLLNALVALDLCVQGDDGAFVATPAGALLSSDAAGNLHAWARFSGEHLWRRWGSLCESVRSGKSERRRELGTDDFSHLDADPKAAALFNRAMVDLTRPVADALVRDVEFPATGSVVDVGGGYGHLVASVLAAYPAMRGVLFDLDHAVAAARPWLTRLGVAERCELVAGSFFEQVPAGANDYLLKSVLHDWDDDHCALILQQCRRAMRPCAGQPARLLVIERLAPKRFACTARDRNIARSDLNMLVSLGGHERTEAEYRALLESAGLRVTQISALSSDYSVIHAARTS
jgi:hypothetical protein